MLKRENRLKSRSSFSATYHNNLTIGCESLVIYLGKEKPHQDCPTRVGFVVSKKVHKRAVKRNRIKRIIRENIRLILKSDLECCDVINKFQSLIFSAKSPILEKSDSEIRNIIFTLLEKIAIKNI